MIFLISGAVLFAITPLLFRKENRWVSFVNYALASAMIFIGFTQI